jgi:PHD/YefM family antitoxin component YafN of YafNO toxin-antitoxin module
MQVYTYSEARQKLAFVLEQAERTGKVLIRKKDGRTFALIPEKMWNSGIPLFRWSLSIKKNVNGVREVMSSLSKLGKKGIVFTGGNYETQPDYIFTRLNEVKPEMIEEAAITAKNVTQKFAADSDSKPGKIKRASQGQFSIDPRDKNNPHIKKVRVVSTVEYYLSD